MKRQRDLTERGLARSLALPFTRPVDGHPTEETSDVGAFIDGREDDPVGLHGNELRPRPDDGLLLGAVEQIGPELRGYCIAALLIIPLDYHAGRRLEFELLGHRVPSGQTLRHWPSRTAGRSDVQGELVEVVVAAPGVVHQPLAHRGHGRLVQLVGFLLLLLQAVGLELCILLRLMLFHGLLDGLLLLDEDVGDVLLDAHEVAFLKLLLPELAGFENLDPNIHCCYTSPAPSWVPRSVCLRAAGRPSPPKAKEEAGLTSRLER